MRLHVSTPIVCLVAGETVTLATGVVVLAEKDAQASICSLIHTSAHISVLMPIHATVYMCTIHV